MHKYVPGHMKKPFKLLLVLLVVAVIVSQLTVVAWQSIERRALADCTLPSGERFQVYYRYHPNLLMALTGVGGLECEFWSATGDKKVFPLTARTDFDIIDDVALQSQLVDEHSVCVSCSRGKWILTNTGEAISVNDTNTVFAPSLRR
jgi:hypothetical protein